MSNARRLFGVLVASGFRAAPGIATLVMVLNLTSRLALMLSPVAVGAFVNAAAHHDGHGLVLAATFVAVTMAGAAGTMTVAAITGYDGLSTHVDLYLTSRVAQLVNRAPGLAHLERPEYAREIELLAEQRQMLAGGPNLSIVLATDIVRTIVMLWLLGRIAPMLALVPVLSAAPFVGDIISTRYRGRVDDSLALDIRLANKLFAITATAAPAKELRVFGAAEELERRHAELAEHIGKRTSRAGVVAGLLSGAGWLIFAAGFAGAVAFVVDRAVHGQASIGDVVVTILLLQRAQFAAGMLAQAVAQLLTAARCARRFLWLEDQVSLPVSGQGAPPARLAEGIVLDRVRFMYPGTTTPVLEDVSIRIPAGTAVAVVGENGAGKTTLAKLLTRMYEPDDGTIRLDGVPLPEISIEAWRERTTATFQDFARYELRAGHVVGIGDLPRHEDDDIVLDALTRASADHLLDALDEGLDTLLGKSFDGGRELSGGQWQNMALGRGRMRDDPLLLVLDEPTASLDAPTEHALFERYLAATSEARSRSGAITMIVSHRFSTVRRADLILVLDGGRIVEHGSHEQLMAASGLYAELFDLQASAYR